MLASVGWAGRARPVPGAPVRDGILSPPVCVLHAAWRSRGNAGLNLHHGRGEDMPRSSDLSGKGQPLAVAGDRRVMGCRALRQPG
jgi:hypothetical protein